MTLETVDADIEALLTSLDLPELPQLVASDDHDRDKLDELSLFTTLTTETIAPERRKRGRKKRNIDPAVKLELDRAHDRKRCSKYRQRKRNERESLQQEVQVLTAELAARQKAAGATKELSVSTWKLLAQSEREARMNAEEKQRRLYAAVEARAAYIREFQELMQRPISAKADVELEAEAMLRKETSRLEPCDGAFYEVFAKDLDAVYAQTEEVLRVCSLDEVSDNHANPIELWRGDCSAGCFMYVDKRMMPRTFQQTCDAFWKAGQLPFRQEDREDYDGLKDPENTAAFKFRVSNHLGTGSVVSALVRFVTRRYVEKDRVVVVWQSLMEGEGMFTGMRAGETGWDVLTPSVDAPETHSVVKSCICHTSMHLGSISYATHTSAVRQFTGMLLGSVADDGAEIAKMIDNLKLTED